MHVVVGVSTAVIIALLIDLANGSDECISRMRFSIIQACLVVVDGRLCSTTAGISHNCTSEGKVIDPNHLIISFRTTDLLP